MVVQKSCLIGSTGFVGTNLLSQRSFSDRFHSLNSDEMTGSSYDEVVCAGASGTKWLANQDPKEDWRRIERLLTNLKSIRAKDFTLISTIDVYGDIGSGKDESYLPYDDDTHAYGLNRQRLEREVLNLFADARIVRLPGIFGKDLKKNLIFDLLNNHEIGRHLGSSAYQWYDLQFLASDIATAASHKIKVVNLFSAPVLNEVLVKAVFADKYAINPTKQTIELKSQPIRQQKPLFRAHYDLCTQHAAVFGQEANSKYRFTDQDVLLQLKEFRAHGSVLERRIS